MSAVIVDWLGRGGIARTSLEWASELANLGSGPSGKVTLMTRTGRELRPMPGVAVAGVASGRHPIVAHARLARDAACQIRRERPTTVVVQNYVVPSLEAPVVEAARRVGARLVIVVHDHRLPPGTAGTSYGLSRLLRRADVIVCHSHFVAERLGASTGQTPIEVLPLPWPSAPTPAPSGREASMSDDALLAVHFGMLGKGYKGTDLVVRLGTAGVPGWRFALVGRGAPVIPGARTIPGFVEHDSLVGLLGQSAATVLPYRKATQSGAVALAQACGSVVVTHPVGGIPEQVENGVTGILVPTGAGDRAWMRALEEVGDPGRRRAIATAGRAAMRLRRREFSERVAQLAA